MSKIVATYGNLAVFRENGMLGVSTDNKIIVPAEYYEVTKIDDETLFCRGRQKE